MRCQLLPFLFLSAISTMASAQHLGADGAQQTFAVDSERYFSDVFFRNNPTAGTQAGFHQYDTQLEDYSAAAVQREVGELHAALSQLEGIPADGLGPQRGG